MEIMRRTGIVVVLSLGLALPGAGAIADTLLVESVESTASVTKPARGATMEQVLQRFGEPSRRHGPVGEPPISHWVYPEFVVYFEHQYVLHSVVPHQR
jgi:hypothetical protein